ncbi:MAG: Gfo/Idh/MocA family oxidoreductase [Acidobacteria bacterium]|nr:Gfo/Idh/MocA family oxidoreductase [Acidobacteriota bacterium]MBS1864969.1 Gfo/Idh/MocA family oxidoreductase [Acidobacteriota bacterium]
MWTKSLRALVICCIAIVCASAESSAQERAPIRVAIAGLVHGHAGGFLRALPHSNSAKLVAIVEPRTDIAHQYEMKFQLDAKLFYTDLEKMLNEQHPDAVLVYTAVGDHRKIIEAAARHGVNSMVEKPLATTLEDALAIREAARKYHIQVLVNYETTWYASNREVYDEVAKGRLGDVRRIVVHDGHQGPKEINVEPEFLEWLTDPVKNGGGALFDFGCYGADLATVLMHGQAPVSVSAVTQTEKPDIYPKVDDEATVILRYPKAQAVLMPSWNWAFSRKDMEVYGATGYAITVGTDRLRVRYAGEKTETTVSAPAPPTAESNSLDYLAGVLRGEIKPDGDASSLETNIVVVQILDAARKSAETGKAVSLAKLPE